MEIVFLDRETLGNDISLEDFKIFGDVKIYNTTNPNERVSRVRDASVIVTNKVVIDKDVIDMSRNLKLICVTATGVNNIDLEYAKSKNIIVKNAVGYSTNSVIQHTFAMLFYLLEKLKYYDDYVKNREWEGSPIFTHLDKPFFEISGKRWGIIGLGKIGESVANVAKSFGCEVVYYSTSKANENPNYKRVELDELLSSSQIISIHSPLNKNTENLLHYNNLSLIQKDAILLNLGRGGIINERDLALIIDEKNIYVGLDVLEYEPMKDYNSLNHVKNSDRLLITPHIAWTSIEARKELVNITFQNIKKFIEEGI